MRTVIATILSIALSGPLISNAHAADVLKLDSNGYVRDWLMLAPIPLP